MSQGRLRAAGRGLCLNHPEGLSVIAAAIDGELCWSGRGTLTEDSSDLIGRARKTLQDLVQREHLSRGDTDLLYRIARAIVHSVSVFEDAGYAVQLLKEPNEALAGATPLSLLGTVEGDEVVHSELGAVEHGMPV